MPTPTTTPKAETTSRTTSWSRPTRTARSRTTKTTTIEARLFGFALGSNLGEREATIRRACEALGRQFGELRVAPLYRSEPVSEIEQPEFLNTVALGHSAQSPDSLLGFAMQLEAELGRRRGRRNGPRVIDIDLLFVGWAERHGPALELPHPRLRERRFVLAPLADLEPDLELPPDGATPGQLLARLPRRPYAVRVHSDDEEVPCPG